MLIAKCLILSLPRVFYKVFFVLQREFPSIDFKLNRPVSGIVLVPNAGYGAWMYWRMDESRHRTNCRIFKLFKRYSFRITRIAVHIWLSIFVRGVIRTFVDPYLQVIRYPRLQIPQLILFRSSSFPANVLASLDINSGLFVFSHHISQFYRVILLFILLFSFQLVGGLEDCILYSVYLQKASHYEIFLAAKPPF